MIAEVLPFDGSELPADVRPLKQEGSEIEQVAAGFLITTEAEHAIACELEKEWAQKEKKAKELTQPSVDKANEAAKAARELRDTLVNPYARARQLLRSKIGGWKDGLQRRAEEERLRLEAARRREDEEAALATASRLEAQGHQEAALRLLDTPAPASIVAAPLPAPSYGVSTRKTWSAKVDNFQELVEWVLKDFESRRHYLEPCLPALNGVARLQKDAMNIPGVKAAWRNC